VRALVRRSPAERDPRVETVVLDLGDRDAVVAALAGASVVYHAGAAMHGPWEDHARGTIAGTRHVIEGCVAAARDSST
jgi:nucleoside-diphosphate-sugar epimerase